MSQTPPLKQDLLASLSTDDAIRLIINHFYEKLFSVLYTVTQNIRSLDHNAHILALQATARNITVELEEMYRKEKFFLFPLIQQSEAAVPAQVDCPSLQEVQIHYSNLLHAISTLINILQDLISAKTGEKPLRLLLERAARLKEKVIAIQHQKQTYLFAPYRNRHCQPVIND